MRNITIPQKSAMDAGDYGPAPMLQWIAIAQLVVDDSYQRELGAGNWSAIRKIARQFRWSRFSPVFVAPVEGGRFAIIDGQHRVHAALMRGIEEVPCQVVQMNSKEQESTFAAINGLVTKVTAWQIFKAALAAGEEWAVEASALCERAGCRLMTSNASADSKKAGEIFAIGLVRGAISAGAGKVMEYALSAMRRSEFGKDPEAYTYAFIKAIFSALVVRSWLVNSSADIASFLDDFDIWAAVDRTEQQAKAMKQRGESFAKSEMLAVLIGEGLDKAFPQRMALPKGGEA